jgi:hypothetical protein
MTHYLFIWYFQDSGGDGKLPQLTDNWHDGGGLIVVAKGRSKKSALSNARKLAVKQTKLTKNWQDEPTHSFDLTNYDGEDSVIIHPDAGCC